MQLSEITRRATTLSNKVNSMSAGFRSVNQRRAMWPPVPTLTAKHVRGCTVFEDRDALLEQLPKHIVCVEVGVDLAEFSKKIWHTVQPSKLHLIDIAQSSIETAAQKFAPEIGAGAVQTHCGDSASLISSFPDQYFDYIYIDGDHSYSGAKRDLEASLPKLKPSGVIGINDYIFFSPSDFTKYGVIEAVNEFCLAHDFRLLYFALQGRMYNDVVLGRMN
jgi:hypothetical protein